MGKQIRFISGDGVEHEVDENSAAAAHMIEAGFQRPGDGDEWHADRDDLPAEEPEVTYTEADAIAQNDGVDDSTAAKAKKKAPAKKAKG